MTLFELNGFQWAALLVITLLFVTTARGGFAGGRRRDRILWTVVWLLAGVFVAWPQGTVVIAHALGIRRGADLVLYCSVLAMMIGFLMVYARLQRLNREITLLTRHIALREAEGQGSSAF